MLVLGATLTGWYVKGYFSDENFTYTSINPNAAYFYPLDTVPKIYHYRDIANGLDEEQAKKQEELYSNIREYIKKHHAENKYEFVLGYSSNGGGILYADNAVDVTQQIIDGLNKEYAAKKGDK